MDGNELPRQIEKLVDHLRETKEAKMSLTDIASVTEVLIATMQSYFQSIDTSIYRECRALSDYIGNARLEIAALTPKETDDENARIPRAGLELDAIVQATEDATNSIMEAAEEIMSADPAETEAYQNTVNDAVMRIFEACSFQDITGQRISKVVETLTYIESRVEDLKNLLGITSDDIDAARIEDDKTGDEKYLRGPALEGEGIDQSEVDALMDTGGMPPAPASSAAEEASEPVSTPAPKSVPKTEAVENSNDDIDALMAEESECVVDQEGPVEEEEPEGKTTTQADIDALFG